MMHLLTDYIEPLTHWLQTNPNWSLLITFIIALTESLAIVGSIVPGSVTMTAIGILAGSGIMRLDLTLIASCLGAICGDGLSYALGYYYSDKLVEIWPFKNYPTCLQYGKDFFARHGGKSVLIGRFVGPLRSIIPVIAGIMHMKQWSFFLANSVSAVGWSLLYVLPGVVIGAAGHELSADSATRLFLIILLVLLCIWLMSMLIKWIFTKIRAFLKNNLHDYWLLLKQSRCNKIYTIVTPSYETDHYPTAGLVVLTFISFIASLLLILLSSDGVHTVKNLDLPIYLCLHSVHTHLLVAVAIICTQLTSVISITCLYLACCFWFLYHKKVRAIIYLSLLIISSSLIAYALALAIDYPRPASNLIVMSGSAFPNAPLLIASSLYGFIFYYINNRYTLLTNTIRSFILIVLGLSGFSSMYLNDYWFSNIIASYFIAACVCLLFCLFYRKNYHPETQKEQSVTILILLFLTIICSTSIATYINFKTLAHAHSPYHKTYVLDQATWWEQQKPILPIYHLTRLGKKNSLLNIQYQGELSLLQSSLIKAHWETHDETFLKKVIMRVNADSNKVQVPLLTQLYDNKRPELIMTYQDQKSNIIFELIIWESNYSLYHSNNPLWIGTLYATPCKKTTSLTQYKVNNSLEIILPALHQFTVRSIQLPHEMIKPTAISSAPYILLIKYP